ncbi:hypothetical protein K502DRAFT_316990 [Neoconidiobolus thromboides FSU 785]|nr:hypothetical protein K502DRAFT_316990 [Neoconidiobolus thromboides FSU 785]
MFYIDLSFVVWVLILTFLVEFLRIFKISRITNKTYVFVAKTFKWKKYRTCCKYVKAIKEATKEESKINSKEEFAKWAKVSRKVEKYRKEHHEAKKNLTYEMSIFQGSLKLAIYILMYGILIVWSILYKSVPTFSLPIGLLGPLEYFAALPNSYLGTVSTLTWITVCFRISKWVIPKLWPNSEEAQELKNGSMFGFFQLINFANVSLPSEVLVPSDIH